MGTIYQFLSLPSWQPTEPTCKPSNLSLFEHLPCSKAENKFNCQVEKRRRMNYCSTISIDNYFPIGNQLAAAVSPTRNILRSEGNIPSAADRYTDTCYKLQVVRLYFTDIRSRSTLVFSPSSLQLRKVTLLIGFLAVAVVQL